MEPEIRGALFGSLCKGRLLFGDHIEGPLFSQTPILACGVPYRTSIWGPLLNPNKENT